MELDKLILSNEIRKSRTASTSPAVNAKTQAMPTPTKSVVKISFNGFGYATGKTKI